jgi:hypothetical protein
MARLECVPREYGQMCVNFNYRMDSKSTTLEGLRLCPVRLGPHRALVVALGVSLPWLILGLRL